MKMKFHLMILLLVNEGTNSLAGIPEEEQEDEMSLYNFKLSGLISGKDHSYISVVSSAGEAITLTLGQFLGKNEFVDLRLTEAIFKKEDGKFLIIDFNNQIRRLMNIKKIFNLLAVLILGFVLSGCANSEFAKKYNKPFKHNTPLIKSNDITEGGKSEISKTLGMGPKPVVGDTRKLGKRKKYLQRLKEII